MPRIHKKSDLPERKVHLLLVGYKSKKEDVENLNSLLEQLPESVGYSIYVNSYSNLSTEKALLRNADNYILDEDNKGYGAAINALFCHTLETNRYVVAMNIDIGWRSNIFQQMIQFMDENEDVGLLVPQIVDINGNRVHLCKLNPTVLALFSRRWIPKVMKPKLLRDYEDQYVMLHNDYNKIFESTYLSGCFMFFRRTAFEMVKGFDEHYFLYLEDADITRAISLDWKTVHYPFATVVHRWGRGNYIKKRLAIINILSAIYYFYKWGIKIW